MFNNSASNYKFCSDETRGMAAEERQKQDNNGGPSNDEEREQRKEWNEDIHCEHITKRDEICPRTNKRQ